MTGQLLGAACWALKLPTSMSSTASTTFSTALCTDKPIVLLDSGSLQFNETVAADIHRRCRIIRLGYDERNRPVVSGDELADAVCGGPDRIDPEAFRKLYLGDYA